MTLSKKTQKFATAVRNKMHLDPQIPAKSNHRTQAFTLVEVVMAIVIIAVIFSGVLMAYVQATTRAQWSGYSLAAQSLAIQQVEQTRSAMWDVLNPVNEITNIPLLSKTITGGGRIVRGYTTNILDIPYSGTNYVRATNFVTIQEIDSLWNGSALPRIPIRMVRVETVWPFRWGGTNRLYTNTICTYAAPDN